MKRKRNKRQHPAAKARTAPLAGSLTVSRGRRWCLRFFGLATPLVLLGLLEIALRVAGYGFPTGFFLHTNDNGRAMLTDNPRFGWRFFPPAVARAPRPLYLAASKPPGTVRILVFGESAAMGDPEPAYGFARQLGRILQERHAGQKVEVVNAAMTAINSHVIRQIAQDCQCCKGDFWLVFSGNNEVIGPFGAGTVFGRQAPSLETVRFLLALKRTRVGQLLAALTRPASEPANWQGLELFLKWQVPREDPRLKKIYASFAANLSDIANLGRRAGAMVLMATVPVNLRACPPFASQHRRGLRPDQLAHWQEWFSAGTQAQAARHFGEALSDFGKAGEIDDQFADLVFQRAVCEAELGKPAPAETDFRLARDLDTLRFRADTSINRIIRQTAAAKSIPLIDAEAEFARDNSERQPALFYDHVHLNFSGNYRLALLFAQEIEKHWPGVQTNHSPWLAETEVARRLAFTDFDERRVGEEMRARLQQPPFSAQSNFAARDEYWRATLAGLSAPPASCISNYLAAVALAPDDWLLHANFARLLEAAGNPSGAAAQWSEVSRLLPHSPEGWGNLGRLARMAGDTEHARQFLQEALEQQPDSVETRTEFGILEASLGRNENAGRQFRAALRLQPGFSVARVNLGLLLAHQGDATGAAAEYRTALRWHPDNIEARINLANLLAGEGRPSEALTLYQQAVALDPENAIARYNFGRLLLTENRGSEAVANFQIALQQWPEKGEIHFELGQALARLGREKEALGEFAQAVRLAPDLVDAHLNYGVALARNRRYFEAETQFRQTLRLRPQDPRAQMMLEQAMRAAHATGTND